MHNPQNRKWSITSRGHTADMQGFKLMNCQSGPLINGQIIGEPPKTPGCGIAVCIQLFFVYVVKPIPHACLADMDTFPTASVHQPFHLLLISINYKPLSHACLTDIDVPSTASVHQPYRLPLISYRLSQGRVIFVCG